jgi:hypothetical protein
MRDSSSLFKFESAAAGYLDHSLLNILLTRHISQYCEAAVTGAPTSRIAPEGGTKTRMYLGQQELIKWLDKRMASTHQVCESYFYRSMMTSAVFAKVALVVCLVGWLALADAAGDTPFRFLNM